MFWTEIHPQERLSTSSQHLVKVAEPQASPWSQSSQVGAWTICKHLGLQIFYLIFEITETSKHDFQWKTWSITEKREGTHCKIVPVLVLRKSKELQKQLQVFSSFCRKQIQKQLIKSHCLMRN